MQVQEAKVESDNEKTVMNTSNLHRIGLTYFEESIKNKQYLRLFNSHIIAKLQEEVMNLESLKSTDKERWSGIFRIMRLTQTTSFQYPKNKNQKILKQIEHISFPKLKEMNLFMGNIQSYEAFAFMDLPNIEVLNLIYNRCINFKAFNKLNWPNLRLFCFYLQDNRVFRLEDVRDEWSHSIGDFSRAGFNLKEMRLQKRDYDCVIMQDLSHLAKLKLCLQAVYIYPRKRIKQFKVVQTLDKGRHNRLIPFFLATPHGHNQPMQYILQAHDDY